VGDGVGDAVGDGVGEVESVGAAVMLGVGVRAIDVTGAHALATIRATMKSLTELP
jgi:hypothetical protein